MAIRADFLSLRSIVPGSTLPSKSHPSQLRKESVLIPFYRFAKLRSFPPHKAKNYCELVPLKMEDPTPLLTYLLRREIVQTLIKVYKWMKGLNKCDLKKVMPLGEQGRTCSNGFKLMKIRFNKDIGKILV